MSTLLTGTVVKHTFGIFGMFPSFFLYLSIIESVSNPFWKCSHFFCCFHAIPLAGVAPASAFVKGSLKSARERGLSFMKNYIISIINGSNERVEKVMNALLIFVYFGVTLSIAEAITIGFRIDGTNAGSSVKYIMLIAFFVIVFRKQLIQQCKSFAENKKKMLITIAVSAAICCLLNHITFNLILAITHNPSENQLSLGFDPNYLEMCLLAPIFEEIVFRAGIQRGLRAIFNKISPKHGTSIAIFLASFIFAAGHLIPTFQAHNYINLLWIFNYLVIGLSFGIAYEKSENNVLASTVVHMINNIWANII